MENIITENARLTSGNNISYWLDSVEPISFTTLNENRTTDVVIVGGGIAGLTIAYSLMQSGKRVVLVEDGNIGSGETGRTTGHLVTALDDRYYNLERMYGEEKTKLIAGSHKAAIDFIERTIKINHIDCDFERLDGFLFLHPTDEKESLSKEFKAAKKAGIEVVKLPTTPGINEIVPSLKFYDQAQFHSLKYLNGLAAAIINMGGAIYTNTQAAKINNEGIVTSLGYYVEAKHVVVATNSPVNNKYIMHLKQYAYRTYVIGVRVKKGSIPKALWWDTGDNSINAQIPPYHYVRIHSLDDSHDLLICGGEDHPTGIIEENKLTEEDRYGLLEYWLKEHFVVEDIIYKWSGQVTEPMDSLGYIGRNPMSKSNIYIVTGDSGNGLTHGTIAGMLIPDLINEKPNPWEKIYDPSRFKLFSSGKTFFKELVGGLVSYLKNKPHDLKISKFSAIKNNEGKVVEFEGKKLGAFRDDNSTLHIVDAECTHLGCLVKWNNDEKSWDCPCHGSRFAYDGKVMNGPANKNLPYHVYHSEKEISIHQ
jgi:glycine/D-amino acid oxidase-like deaminating enzyme/nitrite reductase/ring-hydroxylating ferredoxin subunit